jgi:hypothetical protein
MWSEPHLTRVRPFEYGEANLWQGRRALLAVLAEVNCKFYFSLILFFAAGAAGAYHRIDGSISTRIPAALLSHSHGRAIGCGLSSR